MADSWPKLTGSKRIPVSPWLEVVARDVQFSPEATVETYYAVAQPHYVAAVAVTPERRIKRAELRVALMLRLGMLCTWIRAYNDGGVCEAAIWDCPGGIARR
jgi:hypothetical protein